MLRLELELSSELADPARGARHRFVPEDERFFRARAWQMQLEKSVVRSIRIPGCPRLPDGDLIPRSRKQQC